MNTKYLQELTEAHAISGFEHEVRTLMKSEFETLDCEISYDNLGSIIANKKGNGPKVMLAGHMDEVGYMVSAITDEGFIKFKTVGGWWSQVMLSKEVVLKTSAGKKIYGIVGSTPPHILSPDERNKVVEIDDMYIDFGATSKQEALDAGINIGDMIAPEFKFKQMINDDLLIGKAFDNRVGCYIVTEVIRRLNKEQLNCDLYAVGTVQEEIGCRGAKTSANLINPDIAIAIDTGIAGDTPGSNPNKCSNKLGDGPLITVMDAGTLSHVGFRQHIFNLANELNILYQPDFMKGGATDSAQMHLAHNGAMSITISLATRYLHSQASVISKKDLNAAIDLICEFVTRIDNDTYEAILND